MQSRLSFTVALATAVALVPAALRAQNLTSTVGERLTIAATFGGLSGASDLNDAGTAQWQLGWAATVNGTYWVHQYIGLRASGSWAQDSVESAAIVGRGKFNKFNYEGDVVLRYPVGAGSGTIIPYVLGGAGAISLHQLDSDSTWTKFAGNFGAGLEYRFGQLGVRVEARDYVYKFDRNGFDKTQHDVAWQGGVTVSF